METFDIGKSQFETTTTLIEASAGTGKTYTITSLVVRLLLMKKAEIEEILVVTFTEAAASELKDRILLRLREVVNGYIKKEAGKTDEIDDPFIKNTIEEFQAEESRKILESAIRSFDLAPVFTIHGFCYRVLSENAFETKNYFDLDIISDENLLIQQSVDDFYRRFISKCTKEEAYLIHAGNLYPDEILKFVEKYIKYQDLEILSPEPVEDISRLLSSYFKALSEISKKWSDSKDQLIDLLSKDESLNKQKYKPAYIKARVDYLDEIFSHNKAMPEKFSAEKNGTKLNPFVTFTKSAIEKGTKKGKTPPEHVFFEEAENFRTLSIHVDEQVKNYISIFKRDALFEVRESLEKLKDQYRLLGFNDFLVKVKDGIDNDHNGVLTEILRDKYRAALIDEFQDTDSTQYEIFKRLFKDKIPLFFIGDPKQAIYRFRGADLFAYLTAKKDADKVYTMDVNYRSAQGVVNCVNEIFSIIDNPFIYEDVKFQKITANKGEEESVFEDGLKSSSMDIIYLKGEPGKNYGNSLEFITSYLCSEIGKILKKGMEGKFLLGDKKAAPEDIAILVRSNNEGRQIKKALEQNKIPSVLTSEESIFETNEAVSLLEVLDAILDSSNERKIRGVLTGNLYFKNTQELNTFFREEETWNFIIEKFKKLNFLWREKGVMEMLNELFYGQEILKTAASMENGERRITNLMHLFEILHQEETANDHGVESLLKWYEDKIYNTRAIAKEYELRLESDKNKVKILTVHKSKGLEFPIVFCGFLQKEAAKGIAKEKESLYHNELDYRLLLDLKPERDKEISLLMEKELLSEDLRLFYVALTRAKYKTYFFMNESKKKNQLRSPDYLFEGEDDLEIEDVIDSFGRENKEDVKTLFYDSDHEFEFFDFHDRLNENEFKRCSFTRSPSDKFRISSFSSITSSSHNTNEKYDLESGNTKDVDLNDPFLLGIHGFPKGAYAGTFFHSIFEDMDFQWEDEKIENLISEKLSNYNFEEKWMPHVFSMVKNVIGKDLGHGFCLSDISLEKRMTELEFYYPMEKNGINLFLKELMDLDIDEIFKERLKTIEHDSIEGFMKGFIDLVFEFNGRFYILDWKSNHLGYSFSDYNNDSLKKEMAHTFYFLQYYIYTKALDKYLSYRLGADYSYEDHFGGVFYVFLRGVELEDNSNGVFYDYPLSTIA